MILDLIITLFGASLQIIILMIIFELSPVELEIMRNAYQIKKGNYQRNIGRSLTNDEKMDFSDYFTKWYYCKNWDLWLKS
jgi:hypothetical protein